MNYIILGRDYRNPKKPLYISGFEGEYTPIQTTKLFKEAFVFKGFRRDGVLFIISKLNEENFLNVKWDYEVLFSW